MTLEYLCDWCFADVGTGRAGLFEWGMKGMFFAARVFVGIAVTTVLVLAPLVIAFPDRFQNLPLRAAIALVPGIALGLLLWWRRRGK